MLERGRGVRGLALSAMYGLQGEQYGMGQGAAVRGATDL